ncbi:MAG: SCO family protein [Rectinemataceae bacterium]
MRAFQLAALCVSVVAVSPGLLGAQVQSTGPDLIGTALTRPVAAADFSLLDQTGATFRMSSTRGRVVVLSFIYTHCGDICPYVTIKLKAARELLGADAGKAVFVAVTTDPKRDTPAVIARYSREAGLYGAWHFLTGPLDSVKKVWTDYGVGVHVVTAADLDDSGGGSASDAEADTSKGLGSAEIALVHKMVRDFAGGYEVSHSAPFWIIDPEGRVRVVLNADALPADIVTDVKALESR